MTRPLDPAVADVRRAVRASLADVEPGQTVLVACSGGPDSTALAAATAFEARHAGWTVAAVVVDHGLQAGSVDVAADAAARLRALGLAPVAVVPVQVETHGGPEAAARNARYAAIEHTADEVGARWVLLGHTRDDQAETVLLGLARGSGARSLAGMAAVSGVSGRYRRPLLALPRTTTEQACAAEDLRVWHDPHNEEPVFARVRVRRRVLPVLDDELGPGVPAALARSARLLRADADALDVLAEAAHDDCRKVPAAGHGEAPDAEAPDAEVLDVARLHALLPALRHRVLRRAAVTAGCPATDLTAGHVEAVDALVTRWHGQRGVDLPGGVRAERARAADGDRASLRLVPRAVGG